MPEISVIKSAWKNLRRNYEAAFAAMLVIGLALTMLHGFILINAKASATLAALSQKFSFTVYLRDDADPFEVGKLITALEERPEVAPPVVFTSKEAAFEFVKKNFSLDPSFISTYRLSLPASLQITPRKIEDTTKIESFLEGKWRNLLRDPFASKEKQQVLAKDMLSFIKSVQRSSVKTILFFIVFGIFAFTLLQTLTLHLAFLSRRVEIAALKLIGESRTRLAMPFIFESVMIGIGAFALHVVLTFLIPFEFGTARVLANILILELMGVFFLSVLTGFIVSYLHLRR